MAKSEVTAEPVLREALERFRESQDASDFNRNDAYEDLRFARLAEQWPEDIRKQRQEEARPFLTINRLPSFIRQIVNDSRQNKPAISIHPVDSGADVEKAKVIGGIIRSIERASNADVAYDTAIDHSVSGGFGFFRISIDYVHPESFGMQCNIRRIANPLMVHWDTSSTEFDASDWDYAFVSDFLTDEQFEQKYPDADKVSFQNDERGLTSYWLEDDQVRVAEYWQREQKTRKILLLSNQQVVRADRLPEIAKTMMGDVDMGGQVSDDDLSTLALTMMGAEVLKEREAEYYEVTRRVISGAEVLEEDPWPGSMIPICPVWGEEIILDGRRHFRSMVRDAKDPQQMLNFWRTASTELVALAPKAPWVGPLGFVPPGHEGKWETANSRSYAYLEYDQAAGAMPQRQPFSGVPAGALQEAMNASDDIKSIIGMYDSSLGARSNETSGRAIMARQRESDVSNYHFIDNLSRAIAYCGRVLVEIIPHVYSSQETVRVLGEDMTEEVVRLQADSQAQPNEEGEVPIYDLSTGHYDVTVKVGPSYATQREEARETLIEIMRQVPGAAQFIGDIVMEHLDFVGADKVAERLKLLLPPIIQAAEGIQAPVAPGMQQGMPGMPPPPPGVPQNGAGPPQPDPLARPVAGMTGGQP